jgi:hypothetical protein
MGGYSGSAKDKKIYDLTEVYEDNLKDVVEDAGSLSKLNEEIIKRATQIAEKIAHDIMPRIAERVIREEIEKIKKMNSNGSANNI